MAGESGEEAPAFGEPTAMERRDGKTGQPSGSELALIASLSMSLDTSCLCLAHCEGWIRSSHETRLTTVCWEVLVNLGLNQ